MTEIFLLPNKIDDDDRNNKNANFPPIRILTVLCMLMPVGWLESNSILCARKCLQRFG